MDMNRYCKNCGDIVEFPYGEATTHCSTCDKEIERQDAIAGWTREARINQLKAMHELMCSANDEMIYMSWIYTMPDCPSEEDFIDIAMNDDDYNACFDTFIRLIQKDDNRW